MPPLVEITTGGLVSLCRHSNDDDRRTKMGGRGGGLRMFRKLKLLSMLTSGCKMAALLGRPNNKALMLSGDKASTTTITLFGYRRGRVSLAIHENPKSAPVFLLELPMLTSTLHKEMASGLVKIALESEGRRRKKLVEECVWAVYCNGRKSGYSVRKKQEAWSSEERQVMQLLRGVSMGAGVLPSCVSSAAAAAAAADGELTYMRARFERVVGSKDSEALYMINPDGTGVPELSVFLVRVK